MVYRPSFAPESVIQEAAQVVSLAGILAVFTIGIIIVSNIDSNMLKNLKFKPTGLEATFKDTITNLQNKAEEIPIKESSVKAVEIVNTIKTSTHNPMIAFLEISGGIETKITSIYYKSANRRQNFVPIPEMVRELAKEKLISPNVSEIILDFFKLRNRMIHHPGEIDQEMLDKVIGICGQIIALLDSDSQKG